MRMKNTAENYGCNLRAYNGIHYVGDCFVMSECWFVGIRLRE